MEKTVQPVELGKGRKRCSDSSKWKKSVAKIKRLVRELFYTISIYLNKIFQYNFQAFPGRTTRLSPMWT